MVHDITNENYKNGLMIHLEVIIHEIFRTQRVMKDMMDRYNTEFAPFIRSNIAKVVAFG